MDNKRPQLFGNPLSKSLENEATDQDEDGRTGPLGRRRARLERRQIVTDDQGRRRFHGAFTGGFSAGHYNSVATVGGFQPKTFVSRRGEQQDNDAGYSHRPEDYMDDEDFGEFGIAPKKIRLAGEYSKESDWANVGTNVLKPRQDSIGEKILRSMTGGRESVGDENDIDNLVLAQKGDLYGLGYRPLSCSLGAVVLDDNNPLVATLKHGKKLKISGEAFGSGVLDDDEDDADLHHADEYGIDTMSNYKFSSKSSRQQQEASKNCDEIIESEARERHDLDDFVLARDVESMDIGSDADPQYPRPYISADWKMPVRQEPYVPPLEIESKQTLASLRGQIGDLSEKFVGVSSAPKKCNYNEGPSGLVQYSDLKALKPSKLKEETDSPASKDQCITMKRQIVEWRPRGLLCKHFNVTNPYPDDAFYGTKPSEMFTNRDEATRSVSGEGLCGQYGQPAPMEIRRSIFNVCCEENARDADDEDESTDNDDKEEEQPQVVELSSDRETKCRSPRAEDLESDQESDIVLVSIGRKTPEVITLTSSSSADESDDNDAYGPPLPPSRQTLQAIDRSAGVRSSSQSSLSISDCKVKKKKKKKSGKVMDER